MLAKFSMGFIGGSNDAINILLFNSYPNAEKVVAIRIVLPIIPAEYLQGIWCVCITET